MAQLNVLAMDYGAGSGRAIMCRYDGRKLRLEELHRFPNSAVACGKGLYWDVLYLFNELKKSLKIASSKGIIPDSIGIDTWGVDYGVLDAQGNLLGNPHCYRDQRTNHILSEVNNIVSGKEIFDKTGMTMSPIFSIFQIYAMKQSEKAMYENADTFLSMPNLLSYFLTGCKSSDSTQASTTLLYNPLTRNWDNEFAKRLGIKNCFPSIQPTGTVIGTLTEEVQKETGLGPVPVICVAGHDTASAIAAVPVTDKEEVVFLSCGTWSVLGTTLPEPLTGRDVYTSGFVNEMGYGDEIMFVKNINGLWILQECEREWVVEGYKINYHHMESSAAASSFKSYIDADYPDFVNPGNMCAKITQYCRKTGQEVPGSREEIYKCINDGLAVKYRDAIEQLSGITGKKYRKLNIVGGGARDSYLCGLTAQLTSMEIEAGPYEATAAGNAIAQLIGLGEIKDMKEAVCLIRESFVINKY